MRAKRSTHSSPTRTNASPPGHGEGGFTLVELVVVTLLLLFALGVATQLLLESQRLLLRATIMNTQPSTQLVLGMLRRDLQQAVAVQADEERGMVLTFPDQSRVRYRLEGACLERASAAPTRTFDVARCLLPNAHAWSWQKASSRRVDVEILIEGVDVGAGAQLVADPRLRRPTPTAETASLSVAMRAGGPGGRW